MTIASSSLAEDIHDRVSLSVIWELEKMSGPRKMQEGYIDLTLSDIIYIIHDYGFTFMFPSRVCNHKLNLFALDIAALDT